MQVLSQLDREPRDMQRLVPADTEGRSYGLQRSGLLYIHASSALDLVGQGSCLSTA